MIGFLLNQTFDLSVLPKIEKNKREKGVPPFFF